MVRRLANCARRDHGGSSRHQVTKADKNRAFTIARGEVEVREQEQEALPSHYRASCYCGGMASQKTSIALAREELAMAKKAAAAQGLSLSAFLSHLIRAHVAQEARFDAMGQYLSRYSAGFRLTPKARAAVEAEWSAPLKPVRAKRRRKAA
jgi:hypothetical protein